MITHIHAYSQRELDRNLTLELDIIRNVSRDPKIKTAYILHSNLSKDYSDVTKAIHRLHDKGLISSWCKICDENIFSNNDWKEHEKSINHKSNRKRIKKSDRSTGKTKRFVKLTVDGLKVVIIDSSDIEPENSILKSITSEQFWKYLFENFSNISKKQLAEISKLFENNVLKFEKQYHLPDVFFMNTCDKEIEEYGSNPRTYSYNENIVKPILITLSKNKPLTTKQLLKILPKIEENIIIGLFHRGLISNNDDMFDLTHLGLIELLFYLYRDADIELIWNRLDKNSKKESIDYQNVTISKDPHAMIITSDFEKIRKKYSFLLPDIFNGGNFEKLGISFYEVVVLLMKLYKNLREPEIGDNFHRVDQYSEEFQTLQKLDQIRQQSYHRKHQEYFASPIQKYLKKPDDGLMNNILEYAFFEYFSYSDFSSLEKFFSNIGMKSKNIDLVWENVQHIQKRNIGRKITFDFYSIYKAYCTGWDDSNLENSKVRKWHDKESKSLMSFSKNHIGEIESSILKKPEKEIIIQ